VAHRGSHEAGAAAWAAGWRGRSSSTGAARRTAAPRLCPVSGHQLLKEGDMNAAANKVARAQYDLHVGCRLCCMSRWQAAMMVGVGFIAGREACCWCCAPAEITARHIAGGVHAVGPACEHYFASQGLHIMHSAPVASPHSAALGSYVRCGAMSEVCLLLLLQEPAGQQACAAQR
jgi:hypothetical protein